MSTEHQRYSSENPSDTFAQSADQRGIDIVRTYSEQVCYPGLGVEIPVDGIHQHRVDIGVVIGGIGLVTGTEIELIARATPIGQA